MFFLRMHLKGAQGGEMTAGIFRNDDLFAIEK